MRIVEGEEQVTTGPDGEDSADLVRGEGWIAARRGDGYYLDYDAGEIQSREVSLPITAQEFAQLKADHGLFLTVVHAHGG